MTPVPEIPVLRNGHAYTSVDVVELVHHATGEPVARLSQANSGMVRRDIVNMRDDVLDGLSASELFDISRKAGELFMHATLPLGDGPARQSFDDYIRQLSATTGMPVTYCRNNAAKIHKVMSDVAVVVAGLTRGLDPAILDSGFGRQGGHTVSFYRAGRIFGAVLPSNSPGVHSLWVPAIALKAPTVLKPGREEPWTPLRIIAALVAAGAPRDAFGFYPTDHAGAGELLRSVDRAMLFGGDATTRQYADDPRVELHGPGYSKIVFGEDCADRWERHLDLLVASIAANGGRSCINASAIWTPRHGRAIAEAVASRLAGIAARPADDPRAELAAFANTQFAEAIDGTIEAGLRVPGAADVTARLRGRPRLEQRGRCSWLLPTLIHIDTDRCGGEPWAHPLANREFLLPYAAVVECPQRKVPEAIGPTLVVSAITRDRAFAAALMNSRHVDRLNVGPIPTHQIAWDQPHEGNLFEHLYRRRAYQADDAA